ncbi:MAG: response regulator transcription factor [Polyangiaceae bacterium]|nr:response regulator transcription factor [Polyangiaceae bacterium]
MRRASGEYLVRLPFLDVEAPGDHAPAWLLHQVLSATDESLRAAKVLLRHRTAPAKAPDADGVVLVDAGACTRALDRAASLADNGFHGVVVVVSPPVEEDVLIAGLEHGVHLWHEGPIRWRLLAARVSALVRRVVSDPPGLELPVSVEANELKVVIAGHAARLTPRQFSIFMFLLERREHWFTAGEIVRNVLETCHNEDSSLVRVHVHGIRAALGHELAWVIQSTESRGFRVVLRPDSTPARFKLPHPRYRARER